MMKKLFLLSLLIFADQFSKYLIRHFDGFYICNKNISFGIEMKSYLFWIFWLGAVCFIIFYYKKFFLKSNLALIIILSGALSNIVDRLMLGCVIDFIKIPFWPYFNLADLFITLGVIILIVKTLRNNN